MSNTSDLSDDPLLKALAQSDELIRSKRAERIRWLSGCRTDVGVILGPIETMALLSEAGECFINGHFIATILLAVAFIEHTLTDELSAKGAAAPFASAIKAAREQQLFPEAILERTDKLRLRRNPFCHRKPEGHKHSFGARFLTRREHPQKILEEDAKEALSLMYAFFQLTVKIGV